MHFPQCGIDGAFKTIRRTKSHTFHTNSRFTKQVQITNLGSQHLHTQISFNRVPEHLVSGKNYHNKLSFSLYLSRLGARFHLPPLSLLKACRAPSLEYGDLLTDGTQQGFIWKEQLPVGGLGVKVKQGLHFKERSSSKGPI